MTEAQPGVPVVETKKRGWLRHWRIGLLLVGAGAIALVVRGVGTETIVQTIAGAGPFLPFIVLLEAAWMSMDVFVLRALLGERRHDVPAKVWIHSAITAYAVNILFPAGRTSAEVARAALLAPYLGRGRVAIAAIQIQGSSLLGNAFMSLIGGVAVGLEIGFFHRLEGAILVSALVIGALGTFVLLGAKSKRVRSFAERRLPFIQLATAGDNQAHVSRAIALSFVGRILQGALFTLVLFATSGVFSFRKGLIAQAIAVAGSTFGDMIPQQAGVTEGAFWYFAAALGFEATPAKAVAIAIVVRVCQLLLAALCLVVGFFWKAPAKTSHAALQSPREDR